jgi:hypothetical protein
MDQARHQIAPTLTRLWGHAWSLLRNYFYRRIPENARFAKLAWLAYAAFGALLGYWSATQPGPKGEAVMLYCAYSLPSSYVALMAWSLFSIHQPGAWYIWIALATFNGWLVFRVCCGFRTRKESSKEIVSSAHQ